MIWIAENLFCLWYPTPVWHPKAIRLMYGTPNGTFLRLLEPCEKRQRRFAERAVFSLLLCYFFRHLFFTELQLKKKKNKRNMYSSVYGPSGAAAASMRGYRGSDMISNGVGNGHSNGYGHHPHIQYRGSVGASNSVDLGGQSRRYPRSDFPPTRYRPPLPTYTMQSVSRSSSYGSSANHNKSSTNEVPR